MQQVIVFRHFSRLPIIFLSLVQLGLGLGCMAAQIGGIFTKNPTPGGKPYSPIVSTYLGATGIWAGIFMVFAGIAGFVSSRFRVPGAIMSFMVISVVAALVSPAIIVTSTISIMEMEDNCKGDLHCTDDNLRPKMVLDIVLIVLAAVEYCIASACVITCCWTLYCDPAGYQFEYHDTKRSAKYKRNDVEMHPTHQVQKWFKWFCNWFCNRFLSGFCRRRHSRHLVVRVLLYLTVVVVLLTFFRTGYVVFWRHIHRVSRNNNRLRSS